MVRDPRTRVAHEEILSIPLQARLALGDDRNPRGRRSVDAGARAPLCIPIALSLLSRDQRLARRRPRISCERIRRLHDVRRSLPRAGVEALVLWDTEYAISK